MASEIDEYHQELEVELKDLIAKQEANPSEYKELRINTLRERLNLDEENIHKSHVMLFLNGQLRNRECKFCWLCTCHPHIRLMRQCVPQERE